MPIQSTGSIAELAEELKQFENTHKGLYAQLSDAIKQGKPQGEILKQLESAAARLDRIEEKARQSPAVPIEGGQLAAELMQNRALIDRPKDLGRNQAIQIVINAKAAVSGVSRTIPYVTGVVAPGPSPILRLRNIIPSVSIRDGSIVYTRETAFTNAAAPVAELAAKPESALAYSNVSRPAETIAHWTQVSRQCYEDLAALAQAIEDRLITGLLAVEEDQLLNGSGVSPALEGYMTVATAHAAFPVGTSLFDCLATVVGEQTALGYPPTACVVNATNLMAQALMKSAVEKLYITPPSGLLPTIIASPKMAAGSWLVGQFTASTLFQREDATVQVAYQHADDFTHNRLTILAEMREVLAIYQPAAFVKGTIPAAAI